MNSVFPNIEFETYYRKNATQYIHPLVFTSLLTHKLISQVGVLSYLKLGKTLVQLGDPICDPKNFDGAFSSFIEEARKKKCQPCFFLVSESFAQFCSQKGYFCNSLGPTSFLDLNTYQWRGTLNKNANYVQKKGVKIKHVQLDSPSHPDYIRLCKFNKKWLSQQKQKKELCFVVGRLEEIFLKENHVFIAEIDDTIQGFISAYPYYKDGKVFGYFVDIMRRDQTTYNRGIIELLIRDSFQFFKTLGASEYSIGWLPFSLDTEIFPHNKMVRLLFEEVFHHGNFLYSFKNVALFKKRYHPFFRENYLAYPQETSSLFLAHLTYKIFRKIGFSFYPLQWVKSWLKRNAPQTA